jgi:phospholipid/cholesterol/gamma-HCH transport system substrate-binding protein
VGDLRRTLTATQHTLAQVDTLAGRLVEGEGLVGKVLTDEELYDNLVRTSRHMHLLLQDLRLNPRRYNTIRVRFFGKNQKPPYDNPLDDPAYLQLIDSLETAYSRQLKN